MVEADGAASFDTLPKNLHGGIWADCEITTSAAREKFAAENKIARRIFTADDLKGFPEPPPMPSAPGKKKVVATGCYDWFHSGHVRFTEEASAYGDLYVCLGNDANVLLLKGPGHPLLAQDQGPHPARRGIVERGVELVEHLLAQRVPACGVGHGDLDHGTRLGLDADVGDANERRRHVSRGSRAEPASATGGGASILRAAIMGEIVSPSPYPLPPSTGEEILVSPHPVLSRQATAEEK